MPDAVIPEKVKGRVLLLDGDYLCYYCAGNEDTPPGEAKKRSVEKIQRLKEMSGADLIVIHLTASGSTKGDRYAAATVQPYQGQRSGVRPKNWNYLRHWLETYVGPMAVVKIWTEREADDGMAWQSGTLEPSYAVVGTRDKDMRMFSGLHINWTTYQLTLVHHDEYDVVGSDGLQYGHKWFWLQMLQGDTVDYIPGLPRYVIGGKEKKIGEKTAEKFLQATTNNDQAFLIVAGLYASYYCQDWPARMAEQSVLLWMRRGRDAEIADVLQGLSLAPNPAERIFQSEVYAIRDRVRHAKENPNGNV